MSDHGPSERVEAQQQGDRFLERCRVRDEMIKNLRELLDDITASTSGEGISYNGDRLYKTGVRFKPDFYRKTPDEARAQVLEAIQELEGYSSGGIEVTSYGRSGEEDSIGGKEASALSPEQIDKKWLGELEQRFNAMASLHEGVTFDDVKRSLDLDTESRKVFMEWDRLGHSVNCYGIDEETGDLIFASAWTDVTKVDPRHRNIVFDSEAQEWVERRFPNDSCNGNAVDIAKEMGGQLADRKISEQLQLFITNGWAHVDTPPDVRDIGKEDGNPNDNAGGALYGADLGVGRGSANDHDVVGSLRAARRVKKA